MTTSAQVLGANGVLLPNAEASTSGALPAQPTANPGDVIATSGGSAITGATGQDLPTCMAAWGQEHAHHQAALAGDMRAYTD